MVSPKVSLVFIGLIAIFIQNASSNVIGLGNGCANGPIGKGLAIGNINALNIGNGLAANGIGANGIGIGSGTSATGYGDVSIVGELPVGGSTAITGSVPVIGYVTFEGTVPAGGIVSVATGGCGCRR